MSAGRVSLLYKGIEDEIIYGSPSVSYFRTVYQKYSRFYKHIVDIAAGDGKINFGKRTRITLPSNGGDFIKNIFFRFEFPKVDVPDLVITRGAGFLIFEYIDLYIGGQLIDRLTGDFLYQYMWLTSTPNEISGLDVLSYLHYNTNLVDPRTNTFPLTMFSVFPFYFFRNMSLAVPLFAIHKQKVEIEFKLRKLSELLRYGTTSSYTPLDPAVLDDTTVYGLGIATLPVEYVYVDETLKNRMLKSELSYVITQNQLTKFIEKSNVMERTVELKWVNPVKDFYIFISDLQTMRPYFLSADTINMVGNLLYSGFNTSRATYSSSSNAWSTGRQAQSFELRFNNEVVFDETYQFFQSYFPVFYYTNGNAFIIRTRQPPLAPSSTDTLNEQDCTFMHCYSFSEQPENNRPTGQVNMSRIIDKKLKIRYFTNTDDRYVRIYARNYNVLKIRDGLAGLMFTHNSDYNYDLLVK